MRFVDIALTAKTAMDFGLTTVSIQLVPVLAETAGWQPEKPLDPQFNRTRRVSSISALKM